MRVRLEYFGVENTSGRWMSPLAPLSPQFLLAGGGVLLSLSRSLGTQIFMGPEKESVFIHLRFQHGELFEHVGRFSFFCQ